MLWNWRDAVSRMLRSSVYDQENEWKGPTCRIPIRRGYFLFGPTLFYFPKPHSLSKVLSWIVYVIVLCGKHLQWCRRPLSFYHHASLVWVLSLCALVHLTFSLMLACIRVIGMDNTNACQERTLEMHWKQRLRYCCTHLRCLVEGSPPHACCSSCLQMSCMFYEHYMLRRVNSHMVYISCIQFSACLVVGMVLTWFSVTSLVIICWSRHMTKSGQHACWSCIPALWSAWVYIAVGCILPTFDSTHTIPHHPRIRYADIVDVAYVLASVTPWWYLLFTHLWRWNNPGAEKWVELHKWDNTRECLQTLKDGGYKILVRWVQTWLCWIPLFGSVSLRVPVSLSL